ncbi:MAG: AI-2E family transporter [Deltaproteobacteria bacterium]|nr:AI-2E family transporter [Deltaproteobacteria bacterium]
MKISNIAYTLISLTIIVLILVFGKDLFIPFILALLFWFLIKTVRNSILKIRFFKKIPRAFLTAGSTLILFLLIAVIIRLLTSNIQELSKSLPLYDKNVTSIMSLINSKFDIEITDYLTAATNNFNYTSILKGVFNSLSSIFGNAFMIVIYTLFLIIEESVFMKKISFIYPDESDYNKVNSILTRIDDSISRYITLKTAVSALTGILSYIVLLIIGVDAPLFWAFLIFLMNYIPTIGSLIATIFPAIFATLQFGTLAPFFWVLGGVGAIQVVVGNIIEPKVMGNSLNVSSLVVIITLSLWGSIWGITGMILSVPITVMMVIILSEFKSTKKIAIILSEKGKV